MEDRPGMVVGVDPLVDGDLGDCPLVVAVGGAVERGDAGVGTVLSDCAVRDSELTISAKFTFTPRYSAMVAGAKIAASCRCPVQMPSTAVAGRPASASVAASKRAHCSRVDSSGPVGRLVAARSV